MGLPNYICFIMLTWVHVQKIITAGKCFALHVPHSFSLPVIYSFSFSSISIPDQRNLFVGENGLKAFAEVNLQAQGGLRLFPSVYWFFSAMPSLTLASTLTIRHLFEKHKFAQTTYRSVQRKLTQTWQMGSKYSVLIIYNPYSSV